MFAKFSKFSTVLSSLLSRVISAVIPKVREVSNYFILAGNTLIYICDYVDAAAKSLIARINSLRSEPVVVAASAAA